MIGVVLQWIFGQFCRYLLLTLGFVTFSSVKADVTLNLEFGLIREVDGHIAQSGTLWILVVAAPDSELPGGLKENTSLTSSNIPAVRTDFAGSTILPGSTLGTASIVASGILGSNHDIVDEVKLTNQDYNIIQAGGLIGLYWFPGINGSAAILPQSNFQIGGFQESVVDFNTGGNAAMVVPTNGGQTLTIAYYDSVFTGGLTKLPPSRFTAIHVPPSGYQVWRDAEFTALQITNGDGAPEADPDKDGWLNLLEYATESPPLEANLNPLTLTKVNQTLELQFKRIADPELRYRIEATPELDASPWPDLVIESSGLENVEELVTHSEAIGPGERFFRLSVVPNDD